MVPSKRSLLTSLALALALATPTTLLFSTGCGNNQPAQCAFNADCVEPQEYCDIDTSTCLRHECVEDDECAMNEVCSKITLTCVPKPMNTTPSNNMTTPGNNQTSNNQTTPANNQTTPSNMTTPANNQTSPPNSSLPDNTQPTVASVDPSPGSQITADTEFAITFSEPMDPISISPFSILLTDSLGTEIELEITYTQGETVATARPTSALEAGTRYELTINTFARDVAENVLSEEVSFEYFTAYEERAGDAELARKWAPVLYQEIADKTQNNWRRDVPTRVDFDGDWIARNNLDNVNTQANGGYQANVYYHVSESFTQIFIFYVLYYPSRVERDSNTGMDVEYEHDFTGAVFVIDKESDSLLFVEGLRVTDETDTLISFIRQGSGVDLPGEGRITGSFTNGQLEDGTHYPFYVPSKRHEACNWDDPEVRPPFDTCVHPQRDFQGGKENGVIFRVGDQAQGLPEATANNDGYLEATYTLLPLAEWLWLRRDSYGSMGLFDRGFTYTPAGERPAGPNPMEALFIPRSLESDGATTFGKSPFQWLVQPARSNTGQWFIDPAWTFLQRYSFPQEVSWSARYCYNLFLGEDVENGTCPDRSAQ